MKPTDALLNNILASRQFVTADLYTITLQNGSTLHYCSGVRDITFLGNLYTAGGIPDSTAFGGPFFDRKDNRAKIIWQIGSGNDSLTVDVIPGAATLPGSSGGGSTVTSPDLVYDGSSDSFYSSSMLDASGPLSFSAWFKSTSASGVVLATSSAGVTDMSAAAAHENVLYLDSSGFLRSGWFDGLTQIATSSVAFTDGNWHHAVATITGSSFVRLYIDSTLSASAAIGTLNTQTPELFIADGLGGGGWTGLPTSSHNRFKGETADIRVYNRTLSAAEVTNLFNGSSITSGLIGRYNSTAGTDASTAGNNLTVVNTPTAGTDGPAVFASTTTFPGTGMTFFNGIRVGMFDNADFQLRRAFFASGAYGTFASSNCAVLMFQGAIGLINADRAIATFQIDDYRTLFNQQMPKWLYSPTCQNTLYDTNCTVVAAANASSGTVAAGSSFSFINVSTANSTGITGNASGWFDNGKVVINTGSNAGLSFAVSSFSTAAGTITLTSIAPFAFTTSDTFLAYPGCDRSTGAGGCAKAWLSTGSTVFSNISNFRGMPYIPDPATVY